MSSKPKVLSIITLSIVIFISSLFILTILSNNHGLFNPQRAFNDVKFQVGLGARTLGSEAHKMTANWIISTMHDHKWEVDTQDVSISGVSIINIIAKRGSGSPWIIISSHYDSRLYADKDPKMENRKLPVLGANDGASSVAILLEIGRVLPPDLDKQIWLVFFDAEDQANIPGYSSSLGAQYFVTVLKGKPDCVVILDMVGDKDLNIYMEQNSDHVLNQQIWSVAADLGYTQFIPTYKHAILDDHTPFINVGIRAADLIDFDYPYWHTTQDTLDKVSPDSLKIVGETILNWIQQFPN